VFPTTAFCILLPTGMKHAVMLLRVCGLCEYHSQELKDILGSFSYIPDCYTLAFCRLYYFDTKYHYWKYKFPLLLNLAINSLEETLQIFLVW